ncbi:hypothetical protein [Vreelandella gomseomensis]|uniref:Uncharacterized protein n=1 Tax=Vreelandella gomseomensis TaxID=370766 RepID=A0ABU1GDJ9_9GAMM|nr:hypothetical protein [Halomonas gomseomensis]MDR5875119.1 hypothetical protein [Halomonas gomseomensis]
MSYVYRNPWVRAILPIVLMAMIGVFTNLVSHEITESKKPILYVLLNDINFLYLLIFSLVLAWYQIGAINYDNTFRNSLSQEDFDAYMRREALEGTAKRVKKLIKEGDIDNLRKETQAFKDMFGGDQ